MGAMWIVIIARTGKVSDRFAVVAEVIGLGGILPLVRFLAHRWNILEFR